MSRIDDLIEQYCPNGVSKIPISDLTIPVERISWSTYEGSAKYIDLSSVDRQTGHITDLAEINRDNAPSRAQQIVKINDVLFGTTRPLLRRVSFISENLDGEICSTGFCVLRAKVNLINPKFLYHCIRSADFYQHIESYQSGASYPSISDRKVKSYKLSVPPLEVQDEIVRILDSFTKLEAELEARRKQYDYYRDSLLSLENLTSHLGKDNVKLLPLNDVCTKASSGGTPKRSVPGYFGGNIPWIRSTDLNFKTIGEVEGSLTESGLDNCSAKLIPAGTVLIAMAGATVAKSGITTVEATTNQNCCALEADLKQIKPKFLFHVLCNDYELLKDKGQETQQFLNMTRIKKHDIPVPPLAEQERIVAILDKFDALVNDLSSGLPAEIQARRKQYEYYRDRLLTFTPAK